MSRTPETSRPCLKPLRDNGVQAVRGFFTGEARHAMARRGREVVEGVASGGIRRSGQFALGFDDAWFEAVFADPYLLDLVAEVLGPDLCIASWRVLMKDHHFDGAINVHQDWPYFGGADRKLNVFVPLTPVGEENGGLVFLERSHFYGPLERGDLDVETYGADLVRVCPELDVGDVLLADFLTWHYSAPARAPKDRIMLQLVFQPADDPSSAHLLRGQRRNPFVTPDRFAPLREPLSQLNTAVARSYLDTGDAARAERYARGMLASDGDHTGAWIVLADSLAARGDEVGALAAREAAGDALARLQKSLAPERLTLSEPVVTQAHEPAGDRESNAQRAAALAAELSEIKASRSWRWTAPLRRR